MILKKAFTKIISIFLAILLLCVGTVQIYAQTAPVLSGEGATTEKEDGSLSLPCASAILMDAKTGTVIYEQNADAALPPASVTKVMTLLLVMEAIEAGKIKLDDMVTVSANAASMGGSQVYLKEGETMSVEEMLKCVVIASANDCAVALAELVAGSEEEFVVAMNRRAAELQMVNTHFENTNGLDDTATNHVTSARDIAIMSRELISHPKILEYSGIWMDTIRDGAFGLTNTNRLVRFYPGATGLKTGSTAKAKFCVSATAMREGMHLIAVVMGSPTRDIRNEEAKKLLDYGFSNYALYRDAAADLGDLPTLGGMSEVARVRSSDFSCLLSRGEQARITRRIELPDSLSAPVSRGDTVGRVVYEVDGRTVGQAPILACEDVGKISFWQLFLRLLQNCLGIDT